MGKRSAHGGSLESWRCPEQRRGDRRDEALPWYANTHTESSGTGLVTTRLREEARQLVREAVGGDEHVVIFTGSGSTGAVEELMRILGLHLPSDRDEHREREAAAPATARPVVFIGPYEHHSNVTGVLTDTDAVSELLHRHGVLACFDYAAAGPHVPIVMMAGHRRPLASKDAVFLSPHKLPGGPGTPGVLVVRRELVRNRVPTVPGGGTITYVHATGQHYHNFVVAALNDLSASSAAAAARAPDRTATGCWASTWTTPIGSPARPSTAGSASSRGGPG